MARIALTGATGFIGRRLLDALLGEGHELRALIRRNPPFEHPRLRWHRASLTGAEASASLEALVSGCDTVMHLAGAIRGGSYEALAAVNVDGSAALAAAVAGAAPEAHLIGVSSLAAREPQLSDYAASKRAGELALRARGARVTILRPPAVYGPQDPALAPLWRALAHGWLPRPAPPQARFSLLHVDDLTAALMRLAALGPGERTMTLHDGREGGYRWSDVAELAQAKRGAPVRILPVPRPALLAAATLNRGLAALTGRAPLLTPGKVRELSHVDWVCDNVALRDTLGWAPAIRLEERLCTLPGWQPRARITRSEPR